MTKSTARAAATSAAAATTTETRTTTSKCTRARCLAGRGKFGCRCSSPRGSAAPPAPPRLRSRPDCHHCCPLSLPALVHQSDDDEDEEDDEDGCPGLEDEDEDEEDMDGTDHEEDGRREGIHGTTGGLY